eukprot:scaffold208650_cov27-Tisochrysis_lutea.AAC.6
MNPKVLSPTRTPSLDPGGAPGGMTTFNSTIAGVAGTTTGSPGISGAGTIGTGAGGTGAGGNGAGGGGRTFSSTFRIKSVTA